MTVIGFKTNCAKRPQFTTLYIGQVDRWPQTQWNYEASLR